MKQLICLLFALITSVLYAQLPPLHNYTPSAYGGENQNWKICQDGDKKLYFANNSGLLVFDGASFRLYPSPNGTILRSVASIGDKLYTGSFEEFGYWQHDPFGSLQYTSLSRKIDRKAIEDEEIWKIIPYERWVLFQSLHRLYIYDLSSRKFNIIYSKNSLPKLFKLGSQLYFQKMNEGLFSFVDGKEVLVSDAPIYKEHIIINMVRQADATLVITQDRGIFREDKDGLVEWAVPFNVVAKGLNVYSCEALKDGSLLLGTIAKGIYHLSGEGVLLEHITQQHGLQNNTVLSIYEDVERNVWLGLDNGISRINFSSPFRVYKDVDGALGAVYASAVYKGLLYLGTNQGLFVRAEHSNMPFELIKGTEGQVWLLKEIDGTLFCGHNSGTFVVDGKGVELVCGQLGTWDIKPIPHKKGWLMQGNYEGLHILERQGEAWRYRHKVSGFNVSSRFFEFVNDRELLVNHEYKGVYHLHLSGDYTKAERVAMESSVPRGVKSSLARYNGKVLYFLKEGVFAYEPQRGKFVKDVTLSKSLFTDEHFASWILREGRNGHLWTFSQENIIEVAQGRLDSQPRIEKVPISAALRKDIVGFENLTELDNGTKIIGTTSGFISFGDERKPLPPYRIRLEKIAVNRIDAAGKPLSLQASGVKLPNGENNLYFSMSVPYYGEFVQPLYQYRLEGLHEHWSAWTPSPVITFENLPAGDYILKVRAKIGDTPTQNTETFRFTIAKPWYATDVMLLLYVLLLALAFFTLNRVYRIRYKRQKAKLEEEKRKELALLQLENEKMQMQYESDKLQNEVDTKNKELAATTMSIIKKNELLSSIKEELQQEKQNPYIKSVLSIIDKNITGENDWEYFQEVFNNMDRDFLKRLKSLHPELTPHDIRLCIYLRLNLSSKEIASILSISPRSVEIKRYRLRKKMDLNHNENLIDYILGL